LSSAGPSAFECPTCGAQYKVVRVEADRYPQTSNWSAVNAAGRSMAAMGDSFSNTSWSIVRGAERSARAGAKSIGLCRKDRHEGDVTRLSHGASNLPALLSIPRLVFVLD
jgi:hypothetical protein